MLVIQDHVRRVRSRIIKGSNAPTHVVINAEGLLCVVDNEAVVNYRGRDETLNQGDQYVACRNEGWQLLTCHYHDRKNEWVQSNPIGYPFDSNECFRFIRFATEEDLNNREG